ncbi:MAG: cytochrome c [Elusimicrobiales bacterium]|nr:cytochrome c [Elusimicrobiales bacterium]
MLKGILIGVAATVLSGIAGAYLFLSLGLMPANADAKPSFMEKWAARRSLHATLSREAQPGTGPVAVNDESLLAGIRLYAANCAVCHGAADGKASNIALGLFQRPPQFAKHGVEDDPEGEIHWKIKHGIRLTGMPSYTATMTDSEIWHVTVFLKHMQELSIKAEAVWKALPSAAAPVPASKPGK